MKTFKTYAAYLCVGLLTLSLASCDDDDDEDPFEDLSVIFSYYEGDNFITASSNEITLASNRHIEFGFQEYSDEDFSTVEMTRTIDGVSTTCDMKDDDGNTMWALRDWPAQKTEYTLTVYSTDGESKDFGPYTVNVDAVGAVVKGNCPMSDQYIDAPTRGMFFQSRHIGWGGGSAGNPNYYTVLAEGYPRLLDFATLSVGGELKAISPDDILSTHSFDRLVNDCGFLSTKFEEYTGDIQPWMLEDVDLATIQALPSPAQTELTLSDSIRFVYETSDGKKGLIQVVEILEESGGMTCGVFYYSEQ